MDQLHLGGLQNGRDNRIVPGHGTADGRSGQNEQRREAGAAVAGLEVLDVRLIFVHINADEAGNEVNGGQALDDPVSYHRLAVFAFAVLGECGQSFC